MASVTPEGGRRSERLDTVQFLILMVRGLVALALGVGLFLSPDKTAASLLNFMGMFWLVNGLLLVIRKREELSERASIVLGGVGVVTGLIVIARHFIEPLVSATGMLHLLGGVILATGVAHVTAQRGSRPRDRRRQTVYHVLLGVFEIAMGGILLVSAGIHGANAYWLATVWALVGGVLLISEAVALRTRA